MGIEEIIARAAEGQELSADDREALKAYRPAGKPDSPGKQAAARARLLEKELNEMRARHEAMTEELEHAKAGGSELEKLQRQYERLQAKHAEAEKLVEAERQKHEAARRAAALGKIAIPWLPDVSDKYREMVLADAFEDFSVEDLADAGKTGDIVQRIISENQRFVTAPTKSGGGTGYGEGASANGVFGPKATDWSQPIDWLGLQRSGGPEAVQKKLNEMWAEPARKT
ncbi:MAG: hypothetical protein OEQ39_03015 [Gammaproteobacteria bacterium]|nr:hypothetical protein [Gammaproteobacteria bacterium]MDH3375921.1 hypothetical protein [Gammaproteobacteria bacterium]